MAMRDASFGLPGYDAWKLSGPPEDEYESDEERETALDALARAEHMAESRAMEDHFDRKYGRQG